jgi:hypothetical protein
MIRDGKGMKMKRIFDTFVKTELIVHSHKKKILQEKIPAML